LIRIFVLGVSGVGKTIACRAYAAHHPEFLHVTASTLICKATGATLKQLSTASAEQILANQIALQRAFQSEFGSQDVWKLLIDGQCVVDNGRETVVIPADLIAPLHPSGLILMEDQPEKILQRRLNDVDRERPLRTREEISMQMQMNRLAVRDYASAFAIPVITVEIADAFSFDRAVAELA
jgi:adenylate kinase